MKTMEKLKKNSFGGAAKITGCPECGSDDNTKSGKIKVHDHPDFGKSENYCVDCRHRWMA